MQVKYMMNNQEVTSDIRDAMHRLAFMDETTIELLRLLVVKNVLTVADIGEAYDIAMEEA